VSRKTHVSFASDGEKGSGTEGRNRFLTPLRTSRFPTTRQGAQKGVGGETVRERKAKSVPERFGQISSRRSRCSRNNWLVGSELMSRQPRSAGKCVPWLTSGSDRDKCWTLTPSAKKTPDPAGNPPIAVPVGQAVRPEKRGRESIPQRWLRGPPCRTVLSISLWIIWPLTHWRFPGFPARRDMSPLPPTKRRTRDSPTMIEPGLGAEADGRDDR
jgi:hypothetical protein